MHYRYSPFVLSSTEIGPMIVNRLDQDEQFRGVGALILDNGHYEKDIIDICSKVLQRLRETRGDGVVVIDGGANYGIYTVALAKGMKWWGEVIAIEPQERIYYALTGNIALNNLFNARAFLAALGRKNSIIGVPQHNPAVPRSFGAVSLTEPCGDSPIFKVPLFTIDTIVNGARVDLIKLDLEGMEPEALKGAKETIRNYKPVVVAEFHLCGRDAILEQLPDYADTDIGSNMLLCLEKDDPIRFDLIRNPW